jgi:hypothetical protein
VTDKAGFEKGGILSLGPQCAYRHFPEFATTHAVLLKEIASTKYRNLIKIV